MSVSVLSVSAIFVSLGTLLLVFRLDRRSRAIAEERLSDLSGQTMLLHNNHSARVLCAVICWLYPKARPGSDFVIDCEARDRWPRIREWRLKTARPSEDDIERAMSALQEALRDETTQGTAGRGVGALAAEPSSAEKGESRACARRKRVSPQISLLREPNAFGAGGAGGEDCAEI